MNWQRLARWEKISLLIILLLAIFTRFYILGDRVMSHDESLHTKYSWQLYVGEGYTHNPMMHGPLLFHLNALAYFIFGFGDFASRIFPALAGIGLVLSPWLFRRWLKPGGAFSASLMLLLSPSITYYSRYIRHDIYSLLTAMLVLWAILQYLAQQKRRWLYILAASFALMFTTKETAYIYTAIFALLLFIPFGLQVLFKQWAKPQLFTTMLILLLILTLLLGLSGVALAGADKEEQSLDENGNTKIVSPTVPTWGRIAMLAAALTLLLLAGVIFLGLGETALRQLPLFDLLMVLGTLTLPLGSALLIHLAGGDMLTLYNALLGGNVTDLLGPDLIITVLIVLLTLIGSVLLGLWWDAKSWPIIGALHYGIILVFYTTFFTNALGMLSGLVGALAYWLAQQGVERGSQPQYYYLLMTPLYEYLPLLFSVGGGIGAIGYLFTARSSEKVVEETPFSGKLDLERFVPLCLLGWTILAWLSYTYAGEKMPWLMVHIALPSILLAAWGIGRVIEGVKWSELRDWRGWLLPLSMLLSTAGLVTLLSAGWKLRTLAPAGSSAAGLSLAQLQQLGQVFSGLLGATLFLFLLLWSIRRTGTAQALRIAILLLFLILALITTRTMVMANFENYDLAKEFLVYAHAAPDVKVALKQIEDISWRTTGAPHDIKVAYGEHGSWPFAWYMVAYPNAYFYGADPNAETLKESPAIIAGSEQWEKVEAIVGNEYLHFDYKFLWWPIQDYYGLTKERLRTALTDPEIRAGLWDIIWKRDYQRYADAKGKTITLKEWPHRSEFRLYVRRELANEVWSYRLGSQGGTVVAPQPTPPPDPYAQESGAFPLSATLMLPAAQPRGLTVSTDGTLYVADTANHQIWHLNQQGDLLHRWGEQGSAPGEFQEPGDLAVDEAGNIYVADTWNHRIQKFDAQGKYLTSWGSYGEYLVGDARGNGVFYGPRGIAVGPDEELFVTDTGNKRVQVFDTEGNFLREFGGAGSAPGQLNEPVGIEVSSTGEVYVADTWNERVQTFTAAGEFLRQWDVNGWEIANPEVKPHLALDNQQNVYLTDFTHNRILSFDAQGNFLTSLSGGTLFFPTGIASSSTGKLYLSDVRSERVLGFELP